MGLSADLFGFAFKLILRARVGGYLAQPLVVLRYHFPHAPQEAVGALDALLVPLQIIFRRRSEEAEEPEEDGKTEGEVRGLCPGDLGGTNLYRAVLPEVMQTFDLKQAEDASKNCRTLFLAMLGACLFVFLTIGTTTDEALIFGGTSSPLPVRRKWTW